MRKANDRMIVHIALYPAWVAAVRIVTVSCLACTGLCRAQGQVPVPEPAMPAFEHHQFYLSEPGIEILDIRYNRDCSPADGRLTPEGDRVLLKSYREGSSVYLKYLRADGTIAEITRSPCYIDPVVPAL